MRCSRSFLFASLVIGACASRSARREHAAHDTSSPPDPHGARIAEPEPDDAVRAAPEAAPDEIAPPTAPNTIAWEDIDRVTARGPAWLLRQLGPEPYRPHGRFEGWEITAVFPDAPDLCEPSCDLRAGDVIVKVEGSSLETPDAFAAMFERATTLDSLLVVRIREGVRETVRYRISQRPLPAARGPG